MSWVTKLWAIVEALHEGHSLGNVESWKNRQSAMSSVITILGILLAFKPDLPISGEQLDSIAGGIVTAGSIFVLYLTPATSKKVGFKKKEE